MAKKARSKKRAPRRTRGTRPAALRTARPRKVSPIPEGYSTVTANLVVRDAAAAIAFYEKALGAKELMRMMAPDGKSVWHAEVKIGDSIVFLTDPSPQNPLRAPSPEHPATCGIMLYVRDCDALWKRAVDAGATPGMPVAEMFWGDRMGSVIDPFGVPWMMATRVKVLSPQEMAKGAEAARRAMQQPPPQPSGT